MSAAIIVGLVLLTVNSAANLRVSRHESSGVPNIAPTRPIEPIAEHCPLPEYGERLVLIIRQPYPGRLVIHCVTASGRMP